MESSSHEFAGAELRPARWRLPRLNVALKRFQRDDDGSYAIEFALVALPFLTILFAIIETAFSFWAGQILDATMQDAARLVLTGQAQTGTAITDLATFKSVAICPKLPAFITCADVKVDVRSAASFATVPPFKPDAAGYYDTSTFGYQKTSAGDIVVVRAVYPFPIYTSFLGVPGTVSLIDHKRMLISVATFRNEPF
jgi:Flp pilus assembly protein TadG